MRLRWPSNSECFLPSIVCIAIRQHWDGSIGKWEKGEVRNYPNTVIFIILLIYLFLVLFCYVLLVHKKGLIV